MPEYHKDLSDRRRERTPFEPGDRVRFDISNPDNVDRRHNGRWGTVENVVSGDDLGELLDWDDSQQSWCVDVRTDDGVLVVTRPHDIERLNSAGERDGGP